MTPDLIEQYPFDQAGKVQTSLTLVLCPEAMDMGKHTFENWYARDWA
jgi:hypothetical protein